jgi:hypothetical protein
VPLCRPFTRCAITSPRRTVITSAASAPSPAGGSLLGRGLLHWQAAVARRLTVPLGEEALDADKVQEEYGATLDLLIVGDSIAAGLGAEFPKETLGARLPPARQGDPSHGPAADGGRGGPGRRCRCRAAALRVVPPDVAVIVVGGNDVTHRVPVAESVRHLRRCHRRLRARGAEVVVGTS